MTGNNWEDPFSFALASVGSVSSVFFGIVVIFGSLFVQKLVLAVMAQCYADEAKIAEDILRRAKRASKKRQIKFHESKSAMPGERKPSVVRSRSSLGINHTNKLLDRFQLRLRLLLENKL